MPTELVLLSPKQIGYREYEDRPPHGDEVLVQTQVSGIKHGTELNLLRGAHPFAADIWDPNLRLFRTPEVGEAVPGFYPHPLGSWAAGIVLAVGPEVIAFQPGDRVHGNWGHRQTALKPANTLYPIPEGVAPETMVFTDPARFALAAVHDAEIKLGDRVAVFGMGAIGLLAVQMARLSGAQQIIAIDPIPARLALARQLGADLTINPQQEDTGLAIKQVAAGKGVDVALEISGSYSALQQALRCVHTGGLVVTASYYGDQPARLDLSREWHHNRITLRSSMPGWGNPQRNHPMWDLPRLEQTAVTLLEQGKVVVTPLIGARIPFTRAHEAYAQIAQGSGEKVKFLLVYAHEEEK